MTDIKLSKRMQAVADMVALSGSNLKVADIGCDHAYVSIYLKKNGIAENVIAMDVRQGPIDIARNNVHEYGLTDYIDVRKSDGFESLVPGEAQVAVIAGMGGLLMVDIIKRGSEHLKRNIELILQPQSDIDKVREYIYDIGYVITDEEMLIDEGKYYTVIRAVRGLTVDGPNAVELLYGPVLLRNHSEVLKTYLLHEREKLEEIKGKLEAYETEKSSLRKKELEREFEMIQEALARYS